MHSSEVDADSFPKPALTQDLAYFIFTDLLHRTANVRAFVKTFPINIRIANQILVISAKKIVLLAYCCITGNDASSCRRQCIFQSSHLLQNASQSLHRVLLLHSNTSIPLLPNETVPADPLPALHVSSIYASSPWLLPADNSP